MVNRPSTVRELSVALYAGNPISRALTFNFLCATDGEEFEIISVQEGAPCQ